MATRTATPIASWATVGAAAPSGTINPRPAAYATPKAATVKAMASQRWAAMNEGDAGSGRRAVGDCRQRDDDKRINDRPLLSLLVGAQMGPPGARYSTLGSSTSEPTRPPRLSSITAGPSQPASGDSR